MQRACSLHARFKIQMSNYKQMFPNIFSKNMISINIFGAGRGVRGLITAHGRGMHLEYN